jgi:hypothetical protein
MPRLDQPHVFPARIHKVWIMRCVDVPRDKRIQLIVKRMLERAAKRKKKNKKGK